MMGPKESNWILVAQCPSRLGTVDVVTRFLKAVSYTHLTLPTKRIV